MGVPAVTLVDFRKRQRTQAVNYGGLRYFAGATPMVYDGRIIAEVGFNEAPAIISLTGGTPGSLIVGATYTYAVHWEFVLADGSVQLSPPSVVKQITMAGGQTRVTIVASTPHSLRVALGNSIAGNGSSVTLVVSRTVWDPGTGTSQSVLRRCVATAVPSGIASWGLDLTVQDNVSDTSLATQEPIYTQGERGEFSGPLEMNAPRSCSLITASESRLITAGLVRPFEFQLSRAAFLGEAFHFSEFSQFFGQVAAPIKAVANLDSARLLWTSNDLFAVGSQAPDDIGAGAVDDPLELASPNGLKDGAQFSLLKVPEGTFFQGDDTKLMILPRGASSPVWSGEAIRAELEASPTIVGATRCKRDHGAAFAHTGAGGSRISNLDFRVGEWFIDTPPLNSSNAIEAIADFSGGLAYASGGVVFVQGSGFADDVSTHIDTDLELHPVYPFRPGGHGHVYEALLVGEIRGAEQLTLDVSLDDGVSYTALTTFVVTGTAGSTFKRRWVLPDSVCGSATFRIRGRTNGAATEGLVYDVLTLLVEEEEGLELLAPTELG